METTAKVKLLRYTSNPEQTVALAAKLCYSDSNLDELVEKLDAADNSKFISKLADLGHFSPFEHASFTFTIDGVSRAFLAQVTRHRIASFSVRSQRYVSEDSFDYIIPPSITALGKTAVDKYKLQMDTMLQWYKDWQNALGGKNEKSNEDARFVLPNAIETKMVLTMNARELLHFFNLRCCNRAQWEIQNVANLMLTEVIKVAPNLFKTAGPSCVSGACAEGKMTCGKITEVREKYKKL